MPTEITAVSGDAANRDGNGVVCGATMVVARLDGIIAGFEPIGKPVTVTVPTNVGFVLGTGSSGIKKHAILPVKPSCHETVKRTVAPPMVVRHGWCQTAEIAILQTVTWLVLGFRAGSPT